uniref:Uncharacterized protein n=1 Tax=Anguilla anguilla TaxID=7936 RepID=A0A0E9XV05_ANGAN
MRSERRIVTEGSRSLL